MHLIVGLGNPERRYEKTRHNLGFMAVAALAEQHKASFRRSAVCQGLAAKVTLDHQECSLLLPTTYMNHSGVAVRALVEKTGVQPSKLLVVYDEMALEFGRMRLRLDGSSAGHNGIESIIEHLNTQQFPRLRLGIGRPKPGLDPADYVLSDFTSAETKQLPDFINQALTCIHSWVNHGPEKTMSQFND